MSSAPTTGNGGNGGISKWSTWGRARRTSASPTTDQDSEGSYIPLADLRSTEYTSADTKVFPLVPPHPSASATGDTPPSSDTNKSSGKLLPTTTAPRTVTSLRSTATSPTTASASADSLEARQSDKETRMVYSPSSSSSSPSSPASSGSTCSIEDMPSIDPSLASLPKPPQFRTAMSDRSEEQRTGPPWRLRSEMEAAYAMQVPSRGSLRRSVSTPARDFAAALVDESEEHAAGRIERGNFAAQSFAGSFFSVVRQEGEDPANRNPWKRQQQTDRSLSPGQYMIGIAAEARAWGRVLSGSAGAKGTGVGGTTKGDVDPVALLLPEAGQRVGGPAGRGPLLRRLQGDIPGMLDDFVVVTVTRPGPLYVRLRPDPRGLVILYNFDPVPDDPVTGCPCLGSIESVGSVTPGDAVVSVNRELLMGRPFQEAIGLLREACSSASVSEPCVMCFRKADPKSLGPTEQFSRPRNLEEVKRSALERLLQGEEDGALDEKKLRGITSTGVPDVGCLRPVLWRFLLRCVPLIRSQWAEQLSEQRAQYSRFVQELIRKPAKSVTQRRGVEDDDTTRLSASSKERPAVSRRLLAGGGGGGDETDTATDSSRLKPPSTVAHDRSNATAGSAVPAPSGSPQGVRLARGGGSGFVDAAERMGDFPRERRGFSDLGKYAETIEDAYAARGCRANSTGILSSPTRAERRGRPAVPDSVKPESMPTDDEDGDGDEDKDDDHPLSNKESSEWAALWSDKELMQAIEQDVVRTMPHLAFYAGGGRDDEDDEGFGAFSERRGPEDGGGGGDGNGDGDGVSGDANDLMARGKRSRSEKYRLGRERHLAIARILFVHAKLNTAESYTQGMNEIVATLYFVLATDKHEEWRRHAEADTFFCFTNLMAEIRDVFIQSLDDSESGLYGKMQAFTNTLQEHDPELAQHMVNLALDPRYFALRWFTTLLCREFDLPDTIRLWDSLFASRDRSTFLVFLFVTLLMAQREELLAGDFAANLQLLQAYPPTDVPDLLARSEAMRLYDKRQKENGRHDAEGQGRDAELSPAEHFNAAAKKLWNVATDLAAGAAEKMVGAGMTEAASGFDMTVNEDVGVIAFGTHLEGVLTGR